MKKVRPIILSVPGLYKKDKLLSKKIVLAMNKSIVLNYWCYKVAGAPVKILTSNCRGLNNKSKAKRILSVLVKTKADIIFLQEIHLKKLQCVVFLIPKVL